VSDAYPFIRRTEKDPDVKGRRLRQGTVNELDVERLSKAPVKVLMLRSRFTEHRDRVFNTAASYSGGAGFKPRSRKPFILIEVYRGFPQSVEANAGIVP
jgi:hypothetical protein